MVRFKIYFYDCVLNLQRWCVCVCQSWGSQEKRCFFVCIEGMWYCLLDNGCQKAPLCASDQLRCCGSCLCASIFGSLRVISVGLSALKAKSDAAEQRWGQVQPRPLCKCLLCVLWRCQNKHTQTHTPRSWEFTWQLGLKERERPRLLHLVSLLSHVPEPPKLLPITTT